MSIPQLFLHMDRMSHSDVIMIHIPFIFCSLMDRGRVFQFDVYTFLGAFKILRGKDMYTKYFFKISFVNL